jgi:hypothetical protein
LEDPLGGTEIQSDAFWRASGDVYARIVDAILTVGGFYQRNQRPIFADPNLQLGGMSSPGPSLLNLQPKHVGLRR